MFYFSETLNSLNPARIVNWNKPLSYIKEAYCTPNTKGVFLVSFLFSVSLALFVSFGPVLIYNRFNLSETALSYFLAYFGFWIIITQIVLVSPVSRLIGQTRALRLGIMVMFGGLLGLYFAQTWIWLLLTTPIIAVGVALSYTTIVSLLSILTSNEKQGEILGINASVQSLAFALPGSISGIIAAKLAVSAPIILAVITALFAVYITFKAKSFRQ
jgi:predicted MFS family arabinose efflux permease